MPGRCSHSTGDHSAVSRRSRHRLHPRLDKTASDAKVVADLMQTEPKSTCAGRSSLLQLCRRSGHERLASGSGARPIESGSLVLGVGGAISWPMFVKSALMIGHRRRC